MANFHSIGGNEVEAHYYGGELEDELDSKAYSDGYYAQLTAGAADNLTGRGDATAGEYLFRTTAGTASVSDEGVATVKSIKGRTLRWNQLCENGNFAESSGWSTVSSGTNIAIADGEMTLTYTGQDSSLVGAASRIIDLVATHKYCLRLLAKGTGDHAAIGASLNGSTIDVNNVFNLTAVQSGYTEFSGIMTYVTPSSGTARVRISTGNTFTASDTVVIKNVQLFDLTAMFGAGNEPSTVAEFEALYPLPYYPYDAGSLLSVNMTGIETTGFNQWDGTWENGGINGSTGQNETFAGRSRTFYIPVFPNTEYYQTSSIAVFYYDADKNFLSARPGFRGPATFTTPANCHYIRFMYNAAAMPSDTICINLSWSGYRNGEYEPYWSEQRIIAAIAENFPDGMRGVGTGDNMVCDELTSTEAITRVGVVDLGTLTWSNPVTNIFNAVVSDMATSVANKVISATYDYATNNFNWSSVESYADKSISTAGNNYIYIKDTSYSDAAAFKAAMDGVMLYYEVAEPTVTTYDPPLNLDYRYADFGTERIMVPDGEMSAPPIIEAVYGINATDTIRNLPTNYTSKKSLENLIAALDAHNGTTTTMTWNEGQQAYTFAIADNA